MMLCENQMRETGVADIVIEFRAATTPFFAETMELAEIGHLMPQVPFSIVSQPRRMKLVTEAGKLLINAIRLERQCSKRLKPASLYVPMNGRQACSTEKRIRELFCKTGVSSALNPRGANRFSGNIG
jgi:hypothetical protein